MKIGIYVGSFDPVHNGHIKIANYLVDNYLDKIIIIPTGSYWNKNNLTDINHRIAMLKYFENNKIMIDEDNNYLKYTYQIFRKLKDKYKYDELYLILGADGIVSFDKWVNYKELLEYGLIIIDRSNIDTKKYLELLGKNDKYIIVSELGNIDISSTVVRKYLKDNDALVNDIVNPKVLKYIRKNGLYH